MLFTLILFTACVFVCASLFEMVSNVCLKKTGKCDIDRPNQSKHHVKRQPYNVYVFFSLVFEWSNKPFDAIASEWERKLWETVNQKRGSVWVRLYVCCVCLFVCAAFVSERTEITIMMAMFISDFDKFITSSCQRQIPQLKWTVGFYWHTQKLALFSRYENTIWKRLKYLCGFFLLCLAFIVPF